MAQHKEVQARHSWDTGLRGWLLNVGCDMTCDDRA